MDRPRLEVNRGGPRWFMGRFKVWGMKIWVGALHDGVRVCCR